MPINLTIETNYNRVANDINSVLNKIIEDQNPILIAAASGVLAQVAYRIHTEGRKGDGSKIGTYSNAYLRYRQTARFNRTSDPNIVLSLTRQMENDFSVVAADQQVGLGFKNRTNFDKATWMEERFTGTYNLTEAEEDTVVIVLDDYIDGLFE